MVQSVTVRVPATSANLGAGFDTLGLALDLTQDVELFIGPDRGHGDGLTRLALDAARSAYRLAKVAVPELSAATEQTIPPGRGLGASAAARAAGIVGANELIGGVLTEEQMLALGARLEGHADNMAPALFGGLQVVVRDGDGFRHLGAPLARGLRVAVFVPEFEMPTSESRKLLPQQLSREDAIFNISRAALLVAALAKGDWDSLDAATADRLHQPARERIFPGMAEIMAAARQAGACGAYLSGGGSSIAAFAVDTPERVAEAMLVAANKLGYPGRSMVVSPSERGATVVSSG
jgi:homoserine kinase